MFKTYTFTADGESVGFRIPATDVDKVVDVDVDGEDVGFGTNRGPVFALDETPEAGSLVLATYKVAPPRRSYYGGSDPDTRARLYLRAPFLTQIKAARARGDHATANRLTAELYQAEIDHGFRVGNQTSVPEPISVPDGYDPYGAAKARQDHHWVQKTPFYELKRNYLPPGATKVVAVAKPNDYRIKVFAGGSADKFHAFGFDVPRLRDGLYQIALTKDEFDDLGAAIT